MAKHKMIWFVFPLMMSSVYLAAAHMDDDGAGSDAMDIDRDADGAFLRQPIPADTHSAPPLSGGYHSGTRTAFDDEKTDNDADSLAKADHSPMDSDLSQHPIELPPTPDADNPANADHSPMDSDLSQHPIELPPTPDAVEPPVVDQPLQNHLQAQLPQNAPLILAWDFAQAIRKRAKTPQKVSPALMNLTPVEQIKHHLVPLALHLVNFVVTAPAQGGDIIGPKDKTARALATPGVAGLVQQLQLLGMAIDLLRASASSQIALTTTADTLMGGHVTTVDASGADVAGVAESGRMVNMWTAMTHLRQTVSNQEVAKALENLVRQLKARMNEYEFNNLFQNENHLHQALTRLFINLLNGIVPDNVDECLRYLEHIQVNLLRGIDGLLPPIPANSVRCLTWQVSQQQPNGKEYVIAPYATMMYPQGGVWQPAHIMFYDHMGPYFAGQNMILKVVVDNYLVEIPFEVQIPPHLLSMAVVIVAMPQTRIDEHNGTTQITGVKVVLYAYPPLDIGQQPAPWAFQLN